MSEATCRLISWAMAFWGVKCEEWEMQSTRAGRRPGHLTSSSAFQDITHAGSGRLLVSLLKLILDPCFNTCAAPSTQDTWEHPVILGDELAGKEEGDKPPHCPETCPGVSLLFPVPAVGAEVGVLGLTGRAGEAVSSAKLGKRDMGQSRLCQSPATGFNCSHALWERGEDGYNRDLGMFSGDLFSLGFLVLGHCGHQISLVPLPCF